MDFSLTEAQRLIQQMCRDFARKELRPRAHEVDVTGRFPEENVRKMAELGLMGIMVPREYGGGEADYISYAIASEELAWGCASSATIWSAAASLAVYPILTFGTPEQKERYLPRLASGKILGAFALSEPQAGSDAANLRTTATLDGDDYVINGRKVFTTCGNVAGVTILFAMTDPSKESKGISAFAVDTKTPGYEVEKVEDKMGLHGSPTVSLSFQDMRVPREDLLGREGEGFKVALATLDGGRISVAAMALGIGQAALDESIAYAKQRVQFGKPIAEHQAIQFMLADMAVDIDAARLLIFRAAAMRDAGMRHTKESAMAKMFASEIAANATVTAVQIHGGYGYIKDYAVERFFRDIKVYEIFEGTNEVQRMVIARQLGLGAR